MRFDGRVRASPESSAGGARVLRVTFGSDGCFTPNIGQRLGPGTPAPAPSLPIRPPRVHTPGTLDSNPTPGGVAWAGHLAACELNGPQAALSGGSIAISDPGSAGPGQGWQHGAPSLTETGPCLESGPDLCPCDSLLAEPEHNASFLLHGGGVSLGGCSA
jgi:hypothetical protein